MLCPLPEPELRLREEPALSITSTFYGPFMHVFSHTPGSIRRKTATTRDHPDLGPKGTGKPKYLSTTAS